ncbi:MAG: AbrB family transcriptional regulator [Micrococcales bacterium 72-143]|nr:MAG: AbrB family transcriptional regulator [Micrococcales bacterium 72-143]
MPTATMTSKGQITVPKEVRDDLHLEAGSKVLFVRLADGQYRIVARTGSIMDLAGLLYRPDRVPVTIEQMNEDIAAAAAEHVMRGLES